MDKAVVLFSGGLDSTTVLAMAREHFSCYALSVDYGQRHESELAAAEKMAALWGIPHLVAQASLGAFGGSALTDSAVAVPLEATEGIPVTYVPARNTVMLSLALGYAEVLGAHDIFIGVNAVDYSGYPDCRPEFIDAFGQLANLATKAGVEGRMMHVHAPLIAWSKARIIQEGLKRGVDYAQTVSCYQADPQGRACGRCDACRLRRLGFEEANVADPTRYQSS
ncbi:MAG: 7-cyano-7-deazaguanine synthase QueC [Proteobacteria bacterium]|nr:7-cyano-7-deazaguanine synthase QueC [Pseudomonadota bacterium]MDE3207578.1 7-cyano-7-deazaguanine synthase QueC [Pseudomonadota bacterium]